MNIKKLKSVNACTCTNCGHNQVDGTNLIKAVLCESCGKLHDINSDTYVTVTGNITIGKVGGIVGDNFREDKVYSSVFCRGNCFREVISSTIIPKIDNHEIDESSPFHDPLNTM